MKTVKLLNKTAIQRVYFVLTGTFSLCLVLLLLFYSLFLLLPSIFIKAELIAPVPLLIIFFLALIIPLAIYIYRKPFYGKRFFNEIILPPYSSNDLKSAVELESGRSFPQYRKSQRQTVLQIKIIYQLFCQIDSMKKLLSI